MTSLVHRYTLTFPQWTNNWPIQTDIYCLYCSQPHDNVPIPLPTKRVMRQFTCTGLFCSFNCARAYSFMLGGFDAGARITYLSSLLRQMHYHSKVIKLEPDHGDCVYDWKDDI